MLYILLSKYSVLITFSESKWEFINFVPSWVLIIIFFLIQIQ